MRNVAASSLIVMESPHTVPESATKHSPKQVQDPLAVAPNPNKEHNFTVTCQARLAAALWEQKQDIEPVATKTAQTPVGLRV